MVFGIVAVFFWYRAILKTPETLLESLPKDVDIVLNNVHHESTRHGVKEWVMDAVRAVYLNAENKVLFDDISTTFFLKDGDTFLLTGQRGVLNTDTQDMKITGNIVALGKGYELRTEVLSYQHQKRIIYSTAPFSLVGDTIRLAGHGMRFDLDSGRLNVQEKVRADTISPVGVNTSATPIHIVSDMMMADSKGMWAEFIGNAVATQKDLVIKAERLKIFYVSDGGVAADSNSIKKIIADGNVKIVTGTKTATADHAEYTAADHILVLTGNAEAWSGENIVAGSKITLFLDENRSIVESDDKKQVEAIFYPKQKGGLLK